MKCVSVIPVTSQSHHSRFQLYIQTHLCVEVVAADPQKENNKSFSLAIMSSRTCRFLLHNIIDYICCLNIPFNTTAHSGQHHLCSSPVRYIHRSNKREHDVIIRKHQRRRFNTCIVTALERHWERSRLSYILFGADRRVMEI